MSTAVLLVDPRHPHNVGNALRACALLGARHLYWTGDRVASPDKWPEGYRLPREERMKCYRRTEMYHLPDSSLERVRDVPRGIVPVCVEISDGAEDLRDFVHPDKALYVFGPEDGGVPKGMRQQCHRFVQIPVWISDDDPDARTPYNLAAAVNLVLFDRFVKMTDPFRALRNAPVAFGLRAQGHIERIEEMLANGESWTEIGRRIGWDPETAETFYRMEAPASDPSTA